MAVEGPNLANSILLQLGDSCIFHLTVWNQLTRRLKRMNIPRNWWVDLVFTDRNQNAVALLGI